MADTPRIYVACLAAYNGGTLHGEWIDADQSADDIATSSDILTGIASACLLPLTMFGIEDSFSILC